VIQSVFFSKDLRVIKNGDAMKNSITTLIFTSLCFGLMTSMNVQALEVPEQQIKADVKTLNVSHRIAETSETSSGIEISRIAGCSGELQEARNTILPAKGNLQEPIYNGENFSAPVFTSKATQGAVCIMDDQPLGMVPFTASVMDLDMYGFTNVFECGCGSCYDGEEEFDESEIESKLTSRHRKEYKQYVVSETAKVKRQQDSHNEYVVAYKQWDKNRTEILKKPSVRIAITPKVSLPPGIVEVYSFTWEQYSWCGDMSSADRSNITRYKVEHPGVAAGKTLEMWVEDVDVSIEWGVLLPDENLHFENDFQVIKKEGSVRMETGQLPLNGLPIDLLDRAAETELGVNAFIADDCCAC
jgi:hypothetical protein